MALHRTCTGHSADAGTRCATLSFVQHLRRALRDLYDPAALHRSPLSQAVSLEAQQDGPACLRRIVLEAIEALKPEPGTPSHANSWRVYQILYERHVEQFSQDEVAAHLAVGTRQLRRLESRALRLLADYLCAQRGLSRMAAAPDDAPTRTGDLDMLASITTPSREQELQSLRSHPSEPVSVAELVKPVLRVLTPLLTSLGTGVECGVLDDLPHLMVQLTPVRQALSNLVTAAVHAAPRGRVHVSASLAGQAVSIDVRSATGQPASSPLRADDLDNLDMARRMVGFSGGSLEVLFPAGKEDPFRARLMLPTADEVTVLVIDDNADTLQLLRRYLADTRYRFTGTADPQQALTLAAELAPHLIVLDVMLPTIDGWELLGRLREHPRTRGVPIIVCTILAQQQLALALGAAAFLCKPISRVAFLAALDQQADELLRDSG